MSGKEDSLIIEEDIIIEDDIVQLQWREALEEYSKKHFGHPNYREFLLDLIIKDKLSVEQADWILERIGELSLEDHCGCGCEGGCGCGDQGGCGCKPCGESSSDHCKK